MRLTQQQLNDAALLEVAKLSIQIEELTNSLLEYLRVEARNRSASSGVVVTALVNALVTMTDLNYIHKDERKLLVRYLKENIDQ